jgi:hypothetical protein
MPGVMVHLQAMASSARLCNRTAMQAIEYRSLSRTKIHCSSFRQHLPTAVVCMLQVLQGYCNMKWTKRLVQFATIAALVIFTNK